MATDASSSSSSIVHLSFATDLLFEVESVRAHCTQGLAAQGQLVAMLRSRVALEKQYANELTRMAQQPQFDELEHGTVRDALETLKAQYLNSSVQHRALAQNLDEDVLQPIDALYVRNTQNAQHLAKLVHRLKKQAKSHEDAYKKDFAVFEKQFRDAGAVFAAAMDAGFSSTAIEQQYHHQLMRLQTEEDPQAQALVRSDDVLSPESRSKKQRAAAAALQSSFNNNSQKLVNWLLTSDQARKDNLSTNAAAALEASELSRRKCQRSWRVVEQSRVDMFRALQSVMTEYQQMAELRIANVATNLRKHVVFESSALANKQYDWQMIAGKIESVDAERDIRDFIVTHHLVDLPNLTVRDLCNNARVAAIVQSPTAMTMVGRPLKRVPLEISDVAMRKIPIDRDGGNQTPLAALLVTRVSAAASTQPKERASSALSALPSAVDDAPQFEQLRIDCSSSLRSSRDGPESMRTAAELLTSDDVSELRLAPAQDVARAIARALELRTAQMTPQQQQIAHMQSPTADRSDCEPENDTNEIAQDAAKCPLPLSPLSVTLQSNDSADEHVDDMDKRPHDSKVEDASMCETRAAICTAVL